MPVRVAALLLAVGALAPLLLLVALLAADGAAIGPAAPMLLLAALLGALLGSVAYGTWQGRRGSQVAAAVLGFMLMASGLGVLSTGDSGLLVLAYGATVVALVLVPASARAWFRRTR
ncbi:hypothetical protein [Micromonospora echinospora]|uniref:hypothetical protein n=1 Tax=Micromonospora echinospora TaxID=1877 RepID=UPI003A8851EA